MRHSLIANVLLAALLVGAAPAQPPSPAPAAAGEPSDAVTSHIVTLGGKAVPYTARAGTIVLQDAKGEPACNMFYTAFTLDGADPHTRPVTFFYNGGPGSSTIWLRMGSFGPMRVSVSDGGGPSEAPFDLQPNPYTLLDTTDLVFVDAPGTGFSRLTGAGKSDQFYGVDQDRNAFAQFISRYISAFDRWNSPKFLFGESYGTPRSAVLVKRLQQQGIGINGVVLLSSILDFNLDWDINGTPAAIGGNDWAFPLYLPTETATAWYHNALPGPPTTLAAVLPQAEQFAMGEYLNALAAGDKLPASTRADVVAKLRAYTGLSEEYIRQSNLRIPYWRYLTELMREEGKTMGRYDSRFTSYALDKVQDRPQFDPTESAMDAAYTGAGNYFVRTFLGYKTPLEYTVLSYEVNNKWDWKHGGNLPTNTAQDLAQAMAFNPGLKVFSANGYYDFATPFYATVYTLNHLQLPPALQSNITYGFYESGHMVYLNPASLAQFHTDLERWYAQTLAR
ncbi:MAG: peptidase S10 [Candidatus Eremiobacteraeota bacterium]|nr:peptidase S10 [Candidatus Eremiobacteraeota bacterium]